MKTKNVAQAYNPQQYADLAKQYGIGNDPQTAQGSFSPDELASLFEDRPHPIASVGAGVAEAAGKIGQAYLLRRAKDKEAEKSQAANKVAADAFGAVTGNDPETAMLPIDIRSNLAMAKLFKDAPNLAPAIAPHIMEFAKQYDQANTKPQDKFENVTGVGLAKIPASGGEPSLVPGLGVTKETKLLTPEEEAQRVRIAGASRAPTPAPSSKFAFDRGAGKNRSVTDAEFNANPDNFAPPVQQPVTKLYNTAGQEVGSGDPNDPEIQKRIQSGEVTTATPKQPTDTQVKASSYFPVATAALGKISALEGGGYDPSSNWEAVKGVSNQTASDKRQQYEQATNEFVMAVLRPESGATITPAELKIKRDTLFPIAGDTAATINAKKLSREKAMEELKLQAGVAAPKDTTSKVLIWDPEKQDFK